MQSYSRIAMRDKQDVSSDEASKHVTVSLEETEVIKSKSDVCGN